MAELIPLIASILGEGLTIYSTAKKIENLVGNIKQGKRPTFWNILSIVMSASGGVEIIPDDFGDEIGEELANHIVDEFFPSEEVLGGVQHIVNDERVTESSTSVNLDPSIYQEAFVEIITDPQMFAEVKQYTSDMLGNLIADKINGIDDMIFEHIVESIAETDNTASNNGGNNDGEYFAAAMIPFYLQAWMLFSDMDFNQNGFISPGEFVLHNIDECDHDIKGTYFDFLTEIFDALDSDGDGKIDEMEFMIWQFKLYLRNHYEYCHACQKYIDSSNHQEQECMMSHTGHRFVVGTNVRCPGCNGFTKVFPNLPYFNTCQVCGVNDLTISYQCLQCNCSICIQCEEHGFS